MFHLPLFGLQDQLNCEARASLPTVEQHMRILIRRITCRKAAHALISDPRCVTQCWVKENFSAAGCKDGTLVEVTFIVHSQFIVNAHYRADCWALPALVQWKQDLCVNQSEADERRKGMHTANWRTKKLHKFATCVSVVIMSHFCQIL